MCKNKIKICLTVFAITGCLLNNSADAYMRDSRDYSAADYAKLSGNDYAREMLIGASHSEGQSHEVRFSRLYSTQPITNCHYMA